MILIITILAIVGAIYVSLNKALTANYLWAITNIGFVYHNVLIAEYEMVILFGVYEVIALYGIYNLKYKQQIVSIGE